MERLGLITRQQFPQRVDLFIVEMISFSTAQCCLRRESKESPGAWPLLPSLPGALSSALPSVAHAPLCALGPILEATPWSHHRK